MKPTYFALHAEALRNGSFYKKSGRDYIHYRLGDFVAFVQQIPANLQGFTKKEYKEITGK